MLNMMRFILRYFLFHASFQLVISFEDICNEHCGKTFPLHTLDKVESNIACLRGCRLSKITQMSSKLREKATVISSCSNDCKHAYSKIPELQYACDVGCKYQVIFPTPKPTNQDAVEWLNMDSSYYFPSSVHSGFRQPVIMIKQCWRKMMNKASDIVNIRSSYFFSRGNYIIIDFDATAGEEESKRAPLNVYETISDDPMHEKTGNLNRYTHKVTSNSWNWLNCVESKAGVPRWMLLSLLSLSVCGMIYMCCSSLIEAENILEKKYKFDREMTIDDVPLLKVAPPMYDETFEIPPLYTTFDQGDQQAEPLPEKQPIALVST